MVRNEKEKMNLMKADLKMKKVSKNKKINRKEN